MAFITMQTATMMGFEFQQLGRGQRLQPANAHYGRQRANTMKRTGGGVVLRVWT